MSLIILVNTVDVRPTGMAFIWCFWWWSIILKLVHSKRTWNGTPFCGENKQIGIRIIHVQTWDNDYLCTVWFPLCLIGASMDISAHQGTWGDWKGWKVETRETMIGSWTSAQSLHEQRVWIVLLCVLYDPPWRQSARQCDWHGMIFAIAMSWS